eukprot:sb/3478248/
MNKLFVKSSIYILSSLSISLFLSLSLVYINRDRTYLLSRNIKISVILIHGTQTRSVPLYSVRTGWSFRIGGVSSSSEIFHHFKGTHELVDLGRKGLLLCTGN